MRGPRRSLMLAIPLAAVLVASCGETETVSVEKIVERSVPVERTVEKMVARPAAMAAAAAPAPVEKIVVKEVPVEKLVTQAVAVERVVEKVVTANSSVQGTDPAAAVQSQTSTSSLLTAETQVPDSGRKVIRTGSIGVVVADVPTSVKAIRGMVASIAGAFVVAHRDWRQ